MRVPDHNLVNNLVKQSTMTNIQLALQPPLLQITKSHWLLLFSYHMLRSILT